MYRFVSVYAKILGEIVYKQINNRSEAHQSSSTQLTMQAFVAILLLGLTATAYAGPTSRIVGGGKAADGKYPYQVQLRDGGRFLCGGSIIGTRYILTAAHCVDGRDASKMTILAGTNILGDEKTGKVYQADALIPHPKYGALLIVKNDVALIRLTEDIEYTPKIKPIALPTSDYDQFDKTVVLSGWGKTSTADPPATNLQEIQLNVLTKLKCKLFWIFVKPGHICTLNQKGEGACNISISEILAAHWLTKVAFKSESSPSVCPVLVVHLMSSQGSSHTLTGLRLKWSSGPTSRVVGGIEAVDGKYPYQVLLKLYGDFFCSGSILDSRYILTAAHCLVGKTVYGMTVTVGTNTKSYNTGDAYEVEKLIVHEGFDRFLAINDIALIRLKKNITFSEKARAVKLPSEDVKASGTSVKLSGWGHVGKLMPSSNVLMEVELNIISNEKCNESWKKIKDTQICTLTKAGEGACNEDSGGPLTTENNVQVGIVSYGEACAVGIPDVYTRTYSFLDWIRKNSESPAR
ncbi:hypothetical protein TSAR_005316 [Trichomalopsis sarcophagae]|uniref:chymotrypsin n=1 Tax=Trichomalopsis sarcophagae TaxID=543379 RepID=A0A232F3Q0_9HYME|nr:hypothetical protein TSAR_005316 [Trichomalopsis sarcophagae]